MTAVNQSRTSALWPWLLVLLLSWGTTGARASTSVLAEPRAVGGPPVMRRLTESQYRATVADIFGRDIPVVGRFEPGLRAHGLNAIGTSEAGISPFSIEQYDVSARGIAAAVMAPERRSTLLPCLVDDEQAFDAGCAKQFVEHFGMRLFRRPLSEAETRQFVQAAETAQGRIGGFYDGLEYALAGMMVSPNFLLRIENVENDPAAPGGYRLDRWGRAARLAYFLTGSTPDMELLRAAGAGELAHEQGLAHQVDRLLGSPRFEDAVRAFFEDMLRFELFDDLAKDPIIYPAFNSRVAADAREQTLRTIVYHLVQENGDYRELFTTTDAWLTRPLGTVYRVPVATRNGWEHKQFRPGSDRVGIQANISFLALHSHPGRSSPTLRGKAIREIFLCQHVPDPPVDVDFTGINDTSNKAMPTARDRLHAHATQPACKGCHVLMDPLGLALERFDGLGSFRRRENEALIDVSGSLDGKTFAAAKGLGEALYAHRETPACLVQRLYGAGVGRQPGRAERETLAYFNTLFAGSGYRVPDLMRVIALSDAFYAVTAAGTNNLQSANAGEAEGDQS